MALARIAGCSVNVENRGEPGCSDNDSIYVISGEGAQKLHAVCDNYGFRPGKMENGQFTIEGRKRDLFSAFGDSPAAQQLADALRNAAKPQSKSL